MDSGAVDAVEKMPPEGWGSSSWLGAYVWHSRSGCVFVDASPPEDARVYLRVDTGQEYAPGAPVDSSMRRLGFGRSTREFAEMLARELEDAARLVDALRDGAYDGKDALGLDGPPDEQDARVERAVRLTARTRADAARDYGRAA